MGSTKDELVEEYLENMAAYKLEAEEAGRDWSEGFICLSQAKLDRPIGQHNYDMNMKPTITVANGKLQFSKDFDPLAMFGGAFSPQSLKKAQQAFQKALENAVTCHNSLQAIRRVETALKDLD
ncbi:hypothetical protein B9G98_02873 [Wickerhamiella sorbophila]|uniref:Vacuolar ATPase assembly protein VMA22 n=1 Tax=Wickerhamiella sorbophila TaxID=45607 RepID=A0A2T0FJT3_9ASCO|nr:hypothetical protein B9G98_02873 [Wickerhamiella sorbophila]PRT55253.1 hypothetical protein B9G98_02873 [Wickerhamiella sorbophila]